MRRALLVLASGLLASCGGDTLPVSPAGSPEGRFEPTPHDRAVVSSVVDGETLRLADGRRVSLLGIDAPQGSEACADEAREYLARLALGKTVDVEVCETPPPGQPVPSDGATGYVVVPGTSFVNLELLRAGRAQFRGTVGACGGAAADARLQAGEAEAVAARRGVFGVDACAAPAPPPEPVPAPRPSPTPTPRPSPTPTPTPRPTPVATPTPRPPAPKPIETPRPRPPRADRDDRDDEGGKGKGRKGDDDDDDDDDDGRRQTREKAGGKGKRKAK